MRSVAASELKRLIRSASVGRSADRSHLVVLGLITVSALCLRLFGITYGLPYEYHIDGQLYVSGALRLGAGSSLGIASNGPNLFYYALLAQYGIVYVVLHVLGLVSSTN